MLIQHLAYLQNASIYVIFMQFTNLAKYKGIKINVHNLIKIKQTLNLYVLQNSPKKVKYTLIQLNLGYQLVRKTNCLPYLHLVGICRQNRQNTHK